MPHSSHTVPAQTWRPCRDTRGVVGGTHERWNEEHAATGVQEGPAAQMATHEGVAQVRVGAEVERDGWIM